MGNVIAFKPAKQNPAFAEDDSVMAIYVQYVALYYAKLIQEGEIAKALDVLEYLKQEPDYCLQDLPEDIKEEILDMDYLDVAWFEYKEDTV